MRKDFTVTQDGDLVLGQQLTNGDGEFLYYQDNSGNNETPFITTDPDGNTPIRDAEVCYDDEVKLQLIHARVRTDNPDFSIYPELGANLSDLIGLPNSPETAAQGVWQIRQSLTQDGAFTNDELSIEAIPVSRDDVLFDIQLTQSNPHLRYSILFNFTVGILNAYEVEED